MVCEYLKMIMLRTVRRLRPDIMIWMSTYMPSLQRRKRAPQREMRTACADVCGVWCCVIYRYMVCTDQTQICENKDGQRRESRHVLAGDVVHEARRE